MIRYVTRRVVAKTASYTIKKDQPDVTGTLFTNDGATGSVTFTLPAPNAAIAGCFYEFLCTVAQSLIVAGAASTDLICNGNTGAANVGFQVSGQKVGGRIVAICNGTKWVCLGDRAGGGFCVAGTEQLAINTGTVGVAAGYKVARGVSAVTNAASGIATVVTGLATVVAVTATMVDDPTTTCETVTASIGDQAGSPAAGSILLKGWKTLGGTPAAMTTTSVTVNWIAVGT